MIDPTTQWIIYKDMERELLLEIELRQRQAEKEQHVLAQPWYIHVVNGLMQVFLHIALGKRDVGKDHLAPTGTPSNVCCCSCQ